MAKDKSEKKEKKRAHTEVEDVDVDMVDAEKSPKKVKKEKEEIVIPVEDLSPLAHPLAQKKLLKKIHKTVKKAAKARQVKRGVKEVVKGIRKGEKGLLILAADINPIDIISHLPVLSEEAQIPYIFVSSKEELGNASSTKRPTSCVMVCPDQKKKGKAKEEEEKDDEFRELYSEVYSEVEKLNVQVSYINFYCFLSAMPPKSKSAPANGAAAKGTAPSTNGTTTPVSAADKKDTSLDTPQAGKPDKKVFDAEQDKIKANIDALQVKLASNLPPLLLATAVRDKIGLASGKSGPGNERRTALYAELDGIRSQQSNSKSSRDKVREQMKTLRENIDKKVKDLQTSKSKSSFKNVAEVDAHIKQLERQVESGSMKLVDEKRALQEISTQKRNRKMIENFQTDQDAIDRDRSNYEELKKQFDDPVAKAASERFDAIKAELEEMKKEGDEAHANRTVLFKERDNLQAELNALWNEKRDGSTKFRESNDRYWSKVNEDRARRAERLRSQRAAEELQKKQERAERIREEAEIPAFQAQIEDCSTLIDYFSGKSNGAVTFKTQAPLHAKAEVAGVPKLEIRQVDAAPEGAVVRKKKGEDEDAYFVGGKKNKGKKAPAKASEPSETATLNVPLATLSALLTLSIPPPASNADVPRLIEDLKTKKEWFEANQSRVTAENISKAEAEIKALNAAAKDAKQEEAAANGDAASPAATDSPAPAVEAEAATAES
ncbi:hypothetical protein R3P38DRAFT_2494737 [Favolaschia claudopus]|uniref:Ribosomal protein eL8/eL30/eS12/Gadd45 domain-containing protein n=1 Tax=Favolaschia claudopus TaxID=2862362 RepID=A0AAW0EBG8_9AGAR